MVSALVSGASGLGSSPGQERFTLTVSVSTQAYKWVTLRWTSIQCKGEQKYSQQFHASETGISSGLMGHLPRVQTFISKRLLHDVMNQLYSSCTLFLQFPDLNALIMRRFKGPNDVEEARQAVHKVQCCFIQALIAFSFMYIDGYLVLFFGVCQQKKAQLSKVVDLLRTAVFPS